ncbi:MAG: hypothetical protein ACR652_23680 [Methylocystis sp.]|uniref:hypothetical protein n=1 Tax=Methylocystis sp. TaxID=1911079 RepID=UPI003DA334C3
MHSEMKIDAALAKLEAGKFSFQMVDAIKNHVRKLERELEVTRSLHASAVRELKLEEYANWRLESETKRLNARIHAILRANILTEKAYRKMAPIANETGRYVDASLKVAGAALERAVAVLKSGEIQAQLVGASAKLYQFFKANVFTEETFRELQRYAIKMGQYLRVFKEHAVTGVLKATAYLSNLRKTSA